MEPSEAATRVDQILNANLEELTEHGRLSILPSEVVHSWGLSTSDVRLLESFGLPPARQDELFGIAAAFQESTDPSLSGELFQLGAYGVAKLGVNPSDGSVRSISPHVLSNIHPQLRALDTDYAPIRLINSNLAAFVEMSWRWHWLLPVVAEQQVRAGEEEVRAWSNATTDAERATLPDFYEGVRDLCEKILHNLDTSDPAALRADGAFWRTVVMEYL